MKLEEYFTTSSIFNILEIIPQAMCIINKRNKELIYSNE
jgi:hypothetical protein